MSKSALHIIHDLVQGSDQWHAHRLTHFNASEAAAMLGISEYQTRTALLQFKATGDEREVSTSEQKRFDDGHAFEAIARAWAEEIIGSELYPIVASREVDGLPLSASYDGVDMSEEDLFEHKTLNQALRESLSRGIIPDQYKPQMEQQLLILRAKRCLFMASNGSRETMLHAWYESDPKVRAAVLAGWTQFKADLASYQHVEVLPEPVATPIRELPALLVQVDGRVVSSNLKEFELAARTFIANIKTVLQTDEDFVNAAKTVTFCKAGEERLALVKQQALEQTASIADLFRTVDVISGELRAKRLDLDKLVEARRLTLRAEIVQAGKDAYTQHLASLNKRLGGQFMPAMPVDFAVCVKGKSKFVSMRDAVDTLLSQSKIAANSRADQIQANLDLLGSEENSPFAFLFNDKPTIVLKENDDCAVLVRSRIDAHKAAKEKEESDLREKMRLEAEARLRADTEAKARIEAEAKAKVEAEIKAKADAEERQRREVEEATRKAEEQRAIDLAKKEEAARTTTDTTQVNAAQGGSATTSAQSVVAPARESVAGSPPAVAPALTSVPARKARPTDEQIVLAVAEKFGVDRGRALAWVLDMDTQALLSSAAGYKTQAA